MQQGKAKSDDSNRIGGTRRSTRLSQQYILNEMALGMEMLKRECREGGIDKSTLSDRSQSTINGWTDQVRKMNNHSISQINNSSK